MICGQSTDFKNILDKFDNLESQITGGLETSASALAANLNVDLNLLDLDVQKMIPALPTVDGLSLPDQMNNLLSMGAGSLDYTSQLASITKNFGPSLTAAGYSLDSIVSEATSALGGGLTQKQGDQIIDPDLVPDPFVGPVPDEIKPEDLEFLQLL